MLSDFTKFHDFLEVFVVFHDHGNHEIFFFTYFFAHGWARSDVKERVVWVDTTKTKVKDKEGKLKEKETTVLEVSGRQKWLLSNDGLAKFTN